MHNIDDISRPVREQIKDERFKDLSVRAKVSSSEVVPSYNPLPEAPPTVKINAKLAALKKPLSMSDVSDMLFEFYKKDHLDGPKSKADATAKLDHPAGRDTRNEPDRTISPLPESVISKIKKIDVLPVTKTNGMSGPSGHNGPVTSTQSLSVSKNVNGDEMASKDVATAVKRPSAPFHPRIKYSNVNNKPVITSNSPAIPTVPNVPIPAVVPSPVIQAPILPPPPAAAAIAAAFFRDGYHNLHQQIRAQELLKQHHPQPTPPIPPLPAKPQFYMQNFLRKHNNQCSDNGQSSSDENDDDDDEYDEEGGNKYPEIDDIHLIEGSRSGISNQLSVSLDTDYNSEESHKYSMMAAQALRSLEFSFGEYGSGGGLGGEENLFQCRHCGKKYRWKSTLRRHENVECGGKEPSHQCPYCPYKSKQRGNLGVHVRKHHANLPQLASKRRSKYSQPREHLVEPHMN